jgi:hypothetical protein
MRRVTLSWAKEGDGVIAVSATDADGNTFPVLDIFRQPLIDKGMMNRGEAQAFQAFAAERICNSWNADMSAADLAESHALEPGLGLSEWGQGHNAACQHLAYVIRRRFEF